MCRVVQGISHPEVVECVVLNDRLKIESDILGPGRFRPGPPRNTKTTFGWFFHLAGVSRYTSHYFWQYDKTQN